MKFRPAPTLRIVWPLLVVLACAHNGLSNTFTVENTADSGAGTLRQAIINANANSGPDRIEFDLPTTGVQTLVLTSGALPAITESVHLDGASQDGYANAPLFSIDANGFITGLLVSADDTTITGLNVANAATMCIQMENCAHVAVQGCYVGTNGAGSGLYGDATIGIYIGNCQDVLIGGDIAEARNLVSVANVGISINSTVPGSAIRVQGNYFGTNADASGAMLSVQGTGIDVNSPQTVIGGANAGAGNLFAGYAHGISLNATATSCTIQGNSFGINVSGNASLGALGEGIYCGADYTMIGGTEPGAGNIIASCYVQAVYIYSNYNTVLGNHIGTDPTGLIALPNQMGIYCHGIGNQIGSGIPGGRNLINACTLSFYRYGIYLDETIDTRIQGNYIGVAADGITPMGNAYAGIVSDDTTNTLIGGTSPGDGNFIINNGQGGFLGGIWISALSKQVSILGNSIDFNWGQGIDLSPTGLAINDPFDLDGGANNNQNYPVLLAAGSDATWTTATGMLNSAINSNYRVELFSGPFKGEGRNYLGAVNVATDAAGVGTFAASFETSVPMGHWFSATATDPAGNTSEFSISIKETTTTPEINPLPASQGFGTVAVVDGSNTQTVTIRNEGTANLSFPAALAITGPDAADFSIVSNATLSPIGPMAGHPVQIVFDPSTTGSKTANLEIVSNDADEPLLVVPLKGKGASGNLTIGSYNGSGPGISTIGTGGNYTSLKAACDAVNQFPLINGDWTFEILNNLVEPANCFIGQETNGNIITFRPAEGVSPTVVFSSTVAYNGFPGQFIIGADAAKNPSLILYPTNNIVIDGSNETDGTTISMTFRGSSNSSQNIIHVLGDSNNAQIKNLRIENPFTGGPAALGVTFSQRYDPANGWTDKIPDNGLVENCIITTNFGNAGQGLSTAISAAAGATPLQTAGITGLRVKNCTFSARARCLFLGSLQDGEFTGNNITIAGGSAGTDGLGVFVFDGGHPVSTPTLTFERNMIKSITAPISDPTRGIAGIQIQSGSPGATYNIRNNQIAGVRGGPAPVAFCTAIRSTGNQDAVFNIEHNSVSVLTEFSPNAAHTTSNTAALAITGTSFNGTLNVRNNIFRCAIPNGVVLLLASSAGTRNFDHNCISGAGVAVTGNLAGAIAPDLAAWQSLTMQDAGSIAHDPASATAPFTGKWVNNGLTNADLHFDQDPGLEYRAPMLPSAPNDMDGTPRPPYTLMGSDDFYSPPVVEIGSGTVGTQVLGMTGSAIEFTTNTSTVDGSLAASRTNANPGGTIPPGESALAPDGSTVSPNKISPSTYWTITNTGLNNVVYTASFSLAGLPGILNADKLVLLKRENSSHPWSALNTTRVGNYLSAAGLTSFSDFAIGSEAGDNPLPVTMSELTVE